MKVGELKKMLEKYPDDMDIVVDVPNIEPEDCGEMNIRALHYSIGFSGSNAVFEIESPYI